MHHLHTIILRSKPTTNHPHPHIQTPPQTTHFIIVSAILNECLCCENWKVDEIMELVKKRPSLFV